MKAIFLAVFVVAVSAAPLPDSGSNAVEMIVNGVPEGAALDVSDLVDIKMKEHAEGAVVATDLLHPYTAVGIAEAAAASEAAATAISNEVSVVNDMPSVYPMPIVVPSPPFNPVEPPHVPEVPSLPIEVVIPDPVVLPSPAIPEVVDEPEQLPVAAPQYNGDVYNDGHVQVQYNGPASSGMLATLQSWFNLAINYFNPSVNRPHPNIHA